MDPSFVQNYNYSAPNMMMGLQSPGKPASQNPFPLHALTDQMFQLLPPSLTSNSQRQQQWANYQWIILWTHHHHYPHPIRSLLNHSCNNKHKCKPHQKPASPPSSTSTRSSSKKSPVYKRPERQAVCLLLQQRNNPSSSSKNLPRPNMWNVCVGCSRIWPIWHPLPIEPKNRAECLRQRRLSWRLRRICRSWMTCMQGWMSCFRGILYENRQYIDDV